ncbi:unnamed protein product, partial [Rotaria sp. Silwood2]
CTIISEMNETFMVRTKVNDSNGLATDKIQIQLQSKLSNEQNSTNQTSRQKNTTIGTCDSTKK